ncbi:MAG: DUF5659 domain-containing protein [Clostridium celatum]|nr:DUF5659 domain-containing protein [Clostridium celatum]MDU4979837.1 DUF5659 domain-containing protein [Clostridium celatum]
MEVIKIFSKRVATELIGRGNSLIRTENNLKRKSYSVFIFEDTEKLKNDLTEISNK